MREHELGTTGGDGATSRGPGVSRRRLAAVAAVLVVTAGGAVGVGSWAASAQELMAPDANLKVAFLGDQGLNPNSVAVLNLIQAEGADLVIHTGDLDYNDNPAAWDAMVTSVLGPDYPYFITIGNHEKWGTSGPGQWSGPDGYQQIAWDRVSGLPGVDCTGDYGVRAVCTYRGLWFLLSGVGIEGGSQTVHANYINQECNGAPYLWKIANWHQNQTAMQVGGQQDRVGWGVYEESLACGAIISTSHEHSYGRTRTLTSTVNQTVDPTCGSATALCVDPGRTFVFHSGLGGHSIRAQQRCLPAQFPYGCQGEWGSIYTSDQGATHGALFMTFHVDGNPNQAEGYFKNINGQVVDSFTITTGGGGGPSPSPSQGTPAQHPVAGLDFGTEQAPYPAANVVDGDLSTRWASWSGVPNAWIQFDLGQVRTVDELRLVMYKGATRTYPVEVSAGTSPGSLSVVWSGDTAMTGGFQRLAFTPVSARYVRVTQTGPHTNGATILSIYEAEVWGTN